MAHFNTAGAGLLDHSTIEAMYAFLAQEKSIGAYEAEILNEHILTDEVYLNLARLINCQKINIALFDSGTRAWVTAAQCLPWRKGGRVFITPYEYAGNLIALRTLQREFLFSIDIIPTEKNGTLDLKWLSINIKNDVQLVSIPHIPSACGITNDIESIGQLVNNQGTFYFVDTCQSAGLLDLDIGKIRCDILTAAGRKFICGPRGTGFGYFSDRFINCAKLLFTDLHVTTFETTDYISIENTARKFEFAERNNTAIIGLNSALLYHFDIRKHYTRENYDHLRMELKKFPGFKVIEPGHSHNGIVAFVHESLDARYVVKELAEADSHCWKATASHTPLFMPAQGYDFFVRASVHHYNTPQQIENLLATLHKIGKT